MNQNVLYVVPDGHYLQTPDGTVYAEKGVFRYDIFARYLTVFDKVVVLGRVTPVETVSPTLLKASGENVSFLPLENYRGPIQYILKYGKLKKQVREQLKDCKCLLLRAPSAVAQMVYKAIRRTDITWALEVVVDPWEYFAPNTVPTKLRPLIRYTWTKNLKKMCQEADGATYVTQHYLQEHYPCRAITAPDGRHFVAGYSDVEIKDGSIVEPKVYAPAQGTFHFIHVASSFEGEGKGHRVLIKALKSVIDRGYDADVTFVGDGTLRSSFEELARELGIYDRTHFVGRLMGIDAVRAALRKADVFVFPTKAEGMPRVLIEAMAEGLPCISAPVCGIPEILGPDWLFKFEDLDGYADKMIYCIEHPEVLTEQSRKNVECAKQFEHSKLVKMRNDFYARLKEAAEQNGERNG